MAYCGCLYNLVIRLRARISKSVTVNWLITRLFFPPLYSFHSRSKIINGIILSRAQSSQIHNSSIWRNWVIMRRSLLFSTCRQLWLIWILNHFRNNPGIFLRTLNLFIAHFTITFWLLFFILVALLRSLITLPALPCWISSKYLGNSQSLSLSSCLELLG